jgi:hypothetical protein
MPLQIDEEKTEICFHARLNPGLWDQQKMRPEVRVRLLRIALGFLRFLAVPDLRIADIVVTGSNAAFNYAATSDIDVHLIVDFGNTACPDLAENFFSAKKSLWNMSHDISIRGHDIEVYVEDTRNPAYSNGVYSLLRGEWVKQPSTQAPRYDDAAVLRKTEQLAARIEELLSGDADEDALADLMRKLWQMRRTGLAAGGEYSTENLAFKALRALGYLDLLRERRRKAQDTSLSL